MYILYFSRFGHQLKPILKDKLKIYNVTMEKNLTIIHFELFQINMAYYFDFHAHIVLHKMERPKEKYEQLTILFAPFLLMLLYQQIFGIMLSKWPLTSSISHHFHKRLLYLLFKFYTKKIHHILTFVFLDAYVILFFHLPPSINSNLDSLLVYF